jgi:hypothetical protein
MRIGRAEEGFVLIIAMIVLAVLMTLTIAMVTTVDVQTSQSGRERSGEAAFNIAESALRVEANQLQVHWPASAASAPATTCSDPTHQASGCTALVGTGALPPDYASATWSANAFDSQASAISGSPSPSGTATPDSLWVRAWATTLNGQTRTIVEQVSRRLTTVALPQNLVTANAVYTSNSGNKIIMEASDASSGVTGTVDVRCTAAAPVYGKGNCLGWNVTQKGQLDPGGTSSYLSGYTSPTGTSSTLTPAQLQALTATAQANGTLYSGCPPDPTSGIVVVTGAVACSYTNSTTPVPPWNSPGAPGALIFLNGSVTFGGTERFYGVLYMANENGSPPPCSLSGPTLATVHSGAQLYGAVFADGCGVVNAGDSANNLNFSLAGLGGLRSYQSATPVQGTFQVVSN